MEGHYTYLSPFVESPELQKFYTAIGLAVVMIIVGFLLTRRIKSNSGLEGAIIPSEKVTVFGFFDLAIEQWLKFQDSILGKHNRKYAPFTATIFFFILFSNLLGLIPGFPAITTTVWINVGMALVVFVYFNYEGIKANGFLGYIKHFCGPIVWLAPILFPIEIFSTVLRLLTLNLRLYWNINADHIVLGIFTELTKEFWIPFKQIPIIFMALGSFVCFIQAFVFSLLTMVYIQLATQHEEHGDSDHGGAHKHGAH